MRGKTKFQAKKDWRERERTGQGKMREKRDVWGRFVLPLNAQRGRTSSDCFAFVVCHTTWLENLVLVGYDDQLTFTQISYDFIVSCFFSIFRQRSRSFPVRCSALAKTRVSNEKGRKKIFLSFFVFPDVARTTGPLHKVGRSHGPWITRLWEHQCAHGHDWASGATLHTKLESRATNLFDWNMSHDHCSALERNLRILRYNDT